MGVVVDTSVFIGFERGRREISLPGTVVDDDLFISAITVSELQQCWPPCQAVKHYGERLRALNHAH